MNIDEICFSTQRELMILLKKCLDQTLKTAASKAANWILSTYTRTFRGLI